MCNLIIMIIGNQLIEHELTFFNYHLNWFFPQKQMASTLVQIIDTLYIKIYIDLFEFI